MNRCSNCGRAVRDPIVFGSMRLGPTCARKLGAVLAKPKRARLSKALRKFMAGQEDGQADLFGGAA